MTTRVLLSFGSAYAELARRLGRDLQAARIDVTLDQWEGGGGVPSAQSVPRGLGDEAFVLVLLTPSDAARSWIGAAWKAAVFDPARSRGIDVLPVRGEICEEVPDFLESLSFADLRNRGYALELRRLVETIRRRSGDAAIWLPDAAEAPPPSTASEALVLEVGPGLGQLHEDGSGMQEFVERVGAMMGDGLFYELGVPFPGLHMRSVSTVPAWSARILIHGFEEAQIDVRKDSILVNAGVETLLSRGLAAEPATNPFTGAPCSWAAAAARSDDRLKDLFTWDGFDYLVLALAAVLRSKASHFIGIGEARAMLARLAYAFPHLVQETVPAAVSEFTFADVLRRLVAEGVSIRNLPRILMALAEWGRVERDPLFLTEYARLGLQRQITHRAARGTDTIAVLLLDPALETSIAAATRNTPTGSYVDLAPDRISALLGAIERPVAQLPAGAEWPLLLTQAEIRSSLRRLIAPALPKLEVVSYDDLRPDVNIQPAGRICLERFEAQETPVHGLRVW